MWPCAPRAGGVASVVPQVLCVPEVPLVWLACRVGPAWHCSAVGTSLVSGLIFLRRLQPGMEVLTLDCLEGRAQEPTRTSDNKIKVKVASPPQILPGSSFLVQRPRDDKGSNLLSNWDFPGGPVDKAPCSQCRGPGSDPWSGN